MVKKKKVIASLVKTLSSNQFSLKKKKKKKTNSIFLTMIRHIDLVFVLRWKIIILINLFACKSKILLVLFTINWHFFFNQILSKFPDWYFFFKFTLKKIKIFLILFFFSRCPIFNFHHVFDTVLAGWYFFFTSVGQGFYPPKCQHS